MPLGQPQRLASQGEGEDAPVALLPDGLVYQCAAAGRLAGQAGGRPPGRPSGQALGVGVEGGVASVKAVFLHVRPGRHARTHAGDPLDAIGEGREERTPDRAEGDGVDDGAGRLAREAWATYRWDTRPRRRL
ncbi:hypothetical protein [Streptomyces sp. NRRL B-24085]|uniref:hypothetical protein n=1 Tax=Streptomyces sp. NRRL B-24085 TaxID=1709476 RepID=UPI00117E2D37|nr:hypothetical protein [Streptomyces sp. NRRL B-24085]